MTPTHLTRNHAMVAGHRIAYADEGSGPVVLLVHGIPTSALLWRKIIPDLARTHRVIAPDLLNYGNSDKPLRADVSIAAQARILAGLLDALGIGSVDLVAHDIGGGVAQIFAVAHPERVRKLVLSSSVCFDSWPIPEFLPLQKPEAERDMSLGDFTGMMRGFLPQGVRRPERLSDEAMEMILAPWTGEEGKRALFRNFRRLNPEYTMAIADSLPLIAHETLILWGREDPFQKPRFAELLAETIPNSRLVWIEDAAHWLMEEKPREVSAALTAFLDG